QRLPVRLRQDEGRDRGRYQSTRIRAHCNRAASTYLRTQRRKQADGSSDEACGWFCRHDQLTLFEGLVGTGRGCDREGRCQRWIKGIEWRGAKQSLAIEGSRYRAIGQNRLEGVLNVSRAKLQLARGM